MASPGHVHGRPTPTPCAPWTRNNCIFTNVALTDDGDVWWEGMTDEPPAHLIDWKGNDWTPESDAPSSHPNSRFTAPASQCPSIADNWEDPAGVPISAILFGGRRATNVPLVNEALVGARRLHRLDHRLGADRRGRGSVGALRRDPSPCCRSVATTWPITGVTGSRWAPRATSPSCRRSTRSTGSARTPTAKFIWPGFGDNSRVLAWVIDRVDGEAGAEETPIGRRPLAGDLDVSGLGLTDDQVEELFAVNPEPWLAECKLTDEYYDKFGDRVPAGLWKELSDLERGWKRPRTTPEARPHTTKARPSLVGRSRAFRCATCCGATCCGVAARRRLPAMPA